LGPPRLRRPANDDSPGSALERRRGRPFAP